MKTKNPKKQNVKIRQSTAEVSTLQQGCKVDVDDDHVTPHSKLFKLLFFNYANNIIILKCFQNIINPLLKINNMTVVFIEDMAH